MYFKMAIFRSSLALHVFYYDPDDAVGRRRTKNGRIRSYYDIISYRYTAYTYIYVIRAYNTYSVVRRQETAAQRLLKPTQTAHVCVCVRECVCAWLAPSSWTCSRGTSRARRLLRRARGGETAEQSPSPAARHLLINHRGQRRALCSPSPATIANHRHTTRI